MNNDWDTLYTLRDFVRWGASRFNAAGLFFGHGTDNALDEALALVLHAVHLDHMLPENWLDCRLDLMERRRVAELLLERVETRKPIAYLTHEAAFAGLEFYVDERVLVPRSPIAELIEARFEPWLDADRVGAVLDLCTGSACIAIACARAFPQAGVDAVELSEEALAVARINRERHALEDRLALYHSDLFAGLPVRRYDLIVSNPPYVSASEMETLPGEYLREPRMALEAADDGLEIVIRMLAGAPRRLALDGIIVVEVGNSAEALAKRFPEVPFLWLDFERGGEGVFLLTASQVDEYQQLFQKEVNPGESAQSKNA